MQEEPDQFNESAASRLYGIRGPSNQVQLRGLLGADVYAADRVRKQLD